MTCLVVIGIAAGCVGTFVSLTYDIVSFLSVAFAIAVMPAAASVGKVVFEESDILFGSKNRLDLCKEVALTLASVCAAVVFVTFLIVLVAWHGGTEFFNLCLLSLCQVETFKGIGTYTVFAVTFAVVAIYIFVANAVVFIVGSLVIGCKRSESYC